MAKNKPAGQKTREEQYQGCLDCRDKYGLQKLGLMSSYAWIMDPKHLLFMLSRYKFVAKMFSGFDRVLEVGCADAFGARVVRQEVNQLTAIDFDPVFIDDATNRSVPPYTFECIVHDILVGPVEGVFDGVYTIDVLEHIPQEKEDLFIKNIIASMARDGSLIIGTPSVQSQIHASIQSREGHINCKDHNGLKELLSFYFQNVFIFSMNDEVVHTGFYPMANYLIALCSHPRES